MQSGDKTAHTISLHAVPGAFATMLLDELRSVGGDPEALLRDSACGLLTDLNGLSFYHRLFAWLIGAQLAEDLLGAVPRPKVQEIAVRLDFGNARAFPRAFLAWTGLTPERWRARYASATITASRPGTPQPAKRRSR